MPKYLLLSVILSAAFLQAQQPVIPAEMGTAPLTGETANRSNSLQYGINLATAFDDNATNPANVNQVQTNITSSIQPQGALEINRTHLNSRFFYAPGFTYSSDISSYNSQSQAVGADIKYLFTKHLSLHLLNAFSLTSNPYATSQVNASLPTLGVLNSPNESPVGANVRSTTEQSQADLVYQFARHTSIGVGGSFNILKYRTLADSSSINFGSIDSRGWSGHAFYSHQMTARYTVGVQYAAQHISSEQSSGQFATLSHQVLGFLTASFSQKVQLSVFAGPQRSDIDNNLFGLQSQVLPSLHRTSFSGGSTFAWQGKHNGLSASFVQQVSDSGLNSGGSLLVRTVNVQMQRQIAQRLSVRVFGAYINNNQLDPLSTLFLADSASAGIGFTTALSRHLNLNFSAQRQQFMGAGTTFLGYRQRSHDVGTVSLSYSFARPIGR